MSKIKRGSEGENLGPSESKVVDQDAVYSRRPGIKSPPTRLPWRPGKEAIFICAADIPMRARPPELEALIAELTLAAEQLAANPTYACTNRVPLVGERLHPIAWQGRQWAVTSHGIERRNGTYAIPHDRLEAPFAPFEGWIDHLARKTWIDLPDFAEALRLARRIKKCEAETLS